MASRWFVFWIALFVIYMLREDYVNAGIFLLFAALTSEPKVKEEQ